GAVPAGSDGSTARAKTEKVQASHARRQGRSSIARASCSRCRQVNIDLPILHLGPERSEIGLAGRLHGFAAGDVKRAEMQAALDDVTFQNAVTEIGHGMGAMSLGGVTRPFVSVDVHT